MACPNNENICTNWVIYQVMHLRMRKTLVLSFQYIMIRETKYHPKPNSRCYTSSSFRLKQPCSTKHSATQLTYRRKKAKLVFRIVHTFVQVKIQYQFHREPPESLRAMEWAYIYINVKLYQRDLPVLMV